MGDKLLLHTFSEQYLVFKVKLEVVALYAYWRKKMMEVHKVKLLHVIKESSFTGLLGSDFCKYIFVCKHYGADIEMGNDIHYTLFGTDSTTRPPNTNNTRNRLR